MRKRRKNTIAVIFKGKRGWYFRLKAQNGEVIAASEAYTRRADAKRGATRVDPRCEVRVR